MLALQKHDQNQLAPTSVPAYNQALKKFNQWLDGRPIDAACIIDFFDLELGKAPPATRGIYKYAIRKSLLQAGGPDIRLIDRAQLDLFFKSVKTGKPDVKVHPDKVLSRDEVERMIEMSSRKAGLKIEFLFKTGVRVSEMLGIRLTDFQFIGDFAHIKILGKGKKQRTIFIPVDLHARIFQTFRPTDLFFETSNNKPFDPAYVYYEVNTAGKRIGRPDVGPHVLRHSFATYQLLVKKQSLKAVSLYLGHSSTAITSEIYLHDSLRPEDILDD